MFNLRSRVAGVAGAAASAGLAAAPANCLSWPWACHTSPALFDAKEERVVKRVLFCRHGQGHHNVQGTVDRLKLFDPTLTVKGEGEARAIFADTPPGRADFKPALALVSPLWRTLQTATLAMAARPDGHVCPMIAMEEVREHNNKNACNHRRPIQAMHRAAFPSIDFSMIDVEGPSPQVEWCANYKESFGILRARAARALAKINIQTEEAIVVFCHATFIRAVLSEVLQLSRHHAAKIPTTGEAIEIWLIETPTGERYWELVDDQKHGREVLRLAIRDDDCAAKRDASVVAT